MKRTIIATLLALALTGTASAGQVTKKFDVAPGNIQPIVLEVDGIRVNQIVFADKMDAPGLFSKGGTTATVRVDNDSQRDYEVGIAIVFFDAEGNIVAAGAGGTKFGSLKKGERDTHSIDFNFVFRNVANAKTFVVTLETKPK